MASAGRFQLSSRLSKLTALYGSLSGSNTPQKLQIVPSEDSCDNMAPAPPLPAPAHVVVHEPPVTREESEATHLQIPPVQPASHVHGVAVPPPVYLPLQPVPIEQPFVDQVLQTQRVRQQVDVAAQGTDQPAHRVRNQTRGPHKLRTLPQVLDDVVSNLHKDKVEEWEEARNSFKNQRVRSQAVIDTLARILGPEAGDKVWKKAKADFETQKPQDDPASASEQHVSSPMEGCADPSTAHPESVATESQDQASPRPQPPSSSSSLSPQLPPSSSLSLPQPPAAALHPTADVPPGTSPPQEPAADRHDEAKRPPHRGAHEQKLKRMALNKARALITWQASVYKQTMEWHDKIMRPMYLTNAGWTSENLSEGKSRIVPPTDWYFTPDGERRRILPLELKHEVHYWKTPEAAVEGAKREIIKYEDDPRDESVKSRQEAVASSSVVMAPGIDTCKGVRPMWPARLMTKEETENYVKANNLTEPDYVPNDDVVLVLLCWNLHHCCTVVKRGQCRRVTLEDLDEMCGHWKAEVSGEGAIVGLGRPIVGPQATVSFLAGLAYAKAFAQLAEFVPLELWIANDEHVNSFTAEQLSNPWSDTPDENVAQQFPELKPCTKCSKCYGPYTVALALDHLRKDGFQLPSPLPIEAPAPSYGHKRERSQASASTSEPPAEPTAKRYKSARGSAKASTTAAGATTTTTTSTATSTTRTPRSIPPVAADEAAAATSASTTESTGVIDLTETDDDDELRRASSTLPGDTAGVLHAAGIADVKAEERMGEEGFEGFEEMKESGPPVREETSVVSEETVVGVMHESEGDEMMDVDGLPEIPSDEEQPEGPQQQEHVQESITEAQRLKKDVDSTLGEALMATCLTPPVELLGLDVMIGGLCTRLEARTLTLRELDVAHGRVVEAVDALAAIGVEKQQPFVEDVAKARGAFWEAASRLNCSEKAQKRHGAGVLSLSREKSLVEHLYSQYSTKRAAESLVPLRDELETAIGVLKCEMAGYDTPREEFYSVWARWRLCLHRAISRSTRTLLLADPRSADHAVPSGHVEQQARYARAMSAIKTILLEHGRQFKFQRGVTTTYFPILDHPFKKTPSGFINEVLRGHAAEYLSYLSDRCEGDKIERISVDGSDVEDDDHSHNENHSRAQGGVPNGDTFGDSNSFIAASVGLAGSLEAVDAVVRGDCRNAFVACRPPGHHALRDGRPSVMRANDWKYGLGFCLLNMVACAAKHCVEHWGLRRVTVVDIDLHHGNGTEEILCHPAARAYQYISIHLDRIYPGTGKKKDSRPPHSVNLVVEDEFMKPKKFRSQLSNVRKHVDAFRPDMILVSAGYDAHRNDPLGHGGLTAGDFHFAFKELQAMADVHCGGRLCAVMEGGYCCSMEHAATARAKRRARGGEYALSTDDQECDPEGTDSETIQDCIVATCKALAGITV